MDVIQVSESLWILLSIQAGDTAKKSAAAPASWDLVSSGEKDITKGTLQTSNCKLVTSNCHRGEQPLLSLKGVNFLNMDVTVY
jgi:hypothetical protein